MAHWQRRLLRRPTQVAVLVISLGLALGFTVATDGVWATPASLREVLRVTCILAILAFGEALVITTGEIDISVGSVFGIAGIAYLGLIPSVGVPLALVAALAVAIGVGVANGFIVTRWAIPSLIATLGMLFILRGLAVASASTNAKTASAETRLDPLLGLFGGFEPGGFSIVILWTVVLGVVLHYMLFWTPLGNRLLAVGGDAMSARSRGVSVSRTKQAAFIACAGLAGLAGILEASKLGYADGATGRDNELSAIAAAVLGGCALAGGRSSIGGTFLGAFILSGIASYLFLERVQPQWYVLLLGLIVVVVSLADRSFTKLVGRFSSPRLGPT